MKNIQIKNSLIFSVIILFIFSSLTPLVFGNNTASIKSSKTTEQDKMLEDLAFYCTTPDGLNEQKYNHYKEQLLNYYQSENSNNDKIIVTEKEEVNIQIETSSEPLIIGPMDSPWPMKSHDVCHTGQSSYSTADNPGIEKWRFYTDGWVEDSPIIDSDGTIYFGGNYGGLPWYLFAVNPDGTEKWKYKTGGLIWGSSPAMAEDGTIYVGSWDTKLYAINPDGTQKWATGSGGSIASSPAIADDGTIYFGTMSSGNSIIAMNPNGTIKWKYQTGYSIVSDPAIADDGTIYIGSGDTYFYAINPNGTLKWRFKTGDIIKAHPSIAEDGTIYIASFDHNLYALNSDGSLKWSRSSGYSGSSSVAIGEDGTLYFGGDKLYAAYPNNGTTKWSFDLGNRVTGKSSPAVSADGTIYVGLEFSYGDGGEIIAINHHGTEKWCKRIAGHWVESSPCIAEDGTIYIGSSDTISSGYLHAFSPQESNTPPGTPIITGPTTGNAGVEYKYTFFSVDPDNNPVSFYLEWDDGTNPSWSKEYASGETAKIKHTWNNQGSYTISVKARDTFDGESGWAYFDITMPRNKIISKDFFIQFLQNHPNLFQLVRFLLKM